jgi:hypothetical protein
MTFTECHEQTAFMCGMRDANGRGFGTAQIRNVCSSMTFSPNGKVTQNSMSLVDHGSYQIRGGVVEITVAEDDGSVTKRTMKLSDDNRSLDGMKLQLPATKR